MTTVEIEQAQQEITLQREIDEAAADLKKSYLKDAEARLHKKATEQVAAAHKRVAEQPKEQQVEQVAEPAPEAAKEA